LRLAGGQEATPAAPMYVAGATASGATQVRARDVHARRGVKRPRSWRTPWPKGPVEKLAISAGRSTPLRRAAGSAATATRQQRHCVRTSGGCPGRGRSRTCSVPSPRR
jgi:hypothetical protein